MKQLRPYQQYVLNELRKRLKETTDPLLVDASVGAGKSLIIAELLLILEKAGWRALCLTMNSTLIQQNAETYCLQGGNAGVYCAGLDKKETVQNVIFASPHSVCRDIKNDSDIARVKFNMIVVDEAHNIDHNNNDSMYMRIFNHYGFMAQSEQYSYRIVGLTGTPYRGKNVSIVGQDQFFKEKVCSISTAWLISKNFLVAPVFGKTHADSLDMSDIKTNNMGKFNHKELERRLDGKQRLTEKIMHEIVSVIESGRNGAFVFASTIKHAAECLSHLPENQAACITADTPHSERKRVLTLANQGVIKYLVNVATLLVGVDVPRFDVCAWLRPTESLIIFIQGIGRVLRLHPSKSDALVLDYAQNLTRHGDIDDPIINEALEQKDPGDPDYCIPCYTCNALNKVTARRCIGKVDDKRCEHYFEFRACDNCGAQNDIVSRHCRVCQSELIDPNKKLTLLENQFLCVVNRMIVWVNIYQARMTPIVNIIYKTDNGEVQESYFIGSEKSKNLFYGKFLKNHYNTYKLFYPSIMNPIRLKQMIQNEAINVPTHLICGHKNGKTEIIKKIFN